MAWLSNSLLGQANSMTRTCGGLWRVCSRLLNTRPVPHLDIAVDGSEPNARKSLLRLLRKRRVTRAQLPDALVDALHKAIAELSVSELESDAVKLNHRLSARHPPTHNSVIQATAQHLQEEYEGVRDTVVEQKMRQHVIRRLKQRIYHWQPVALTTEYEAAVYAVARLSVEYAGLMYCLRQIHDADPAFLPAAMLHYGSGTGAGLWAARELWGRNVVKEFLGIESRACLLELAVLLLRGGSADGPLDPIATFRPLLPPAARIKYPLVVSSHALCELPSQQARLETVASLWERTAAGGRLCVLEPGSKVGYQLMVEARDLVLRLSSRQRVPVHVQAPCPHQLPCPRLSRSLTPCHFSVQHIPLRLSGIGEPPIARTPVSYVTLVKAERPEQDRQWPRVVQEMKTPARHVICRLCTNRGTLEEVVATKRRHGADVYSVVRAARWGDTLPVTLEHVPPRDPES